MGYIIATIAGATVTALMVNYLKKPIEQRQHSEEQNAADDDELVLDFE